MIEPIDDNASDLPLNGDGSENLAEAQRVFKKIKDTDAQAREEKETALRDNYDLVRTKVPVYLEDQELAKERRAKALAAARSADYREKKKAESGLTLAMTPVDVVAKVKELGGWPQWLEAQKTIVVQEKQVEVIKEVIKEVEIIKEVEVQVTRDVVREVEKVVFQDRIVEVEKIREVPIFQEKIVEIEVPGSVRIIEKIVEKPVVKLTAEQKKTYEIGKKMQGLTGFRRKMVDFLMGN